MSRHVLSICSSRNMKVAGGLHLRGRSEAILPHHQNKQLIWHKNKNNKHYSFNGPLLCLWCSGLKIAPSLQSQWVGGFEICSFHQIKQNVLIFFFFFCSPKNDPWKTLLISYEGKRSKNVHLSQQLVANMASLLLSSLCRIH